jgi:hypothetical protein
MDYDPAPKIRANSVCAVVEASDGPKLVNANPARSTPRPKGEHRLVHHKISIVQVLRAYLDQLVVKELPSGYIRNCTHPLRSVRYPLPCPIFDQLVNNDKKSQLRPVTALLVQPLYRTPEKAG